MKREDIEALAELARIKLTPAETERFQGEFDAILEYVSAIKDVAKEDTSAPKVGTIHNIFREDTDPTPADAYTEDLLALAPKRQGRYLEVKKVLPTDHG